MAVSKMDDLRNRMAGNVAESMGANRQAQNGAGGRVATGPVQVDPLDYTTRRSTARTIGLDRIMANPDEAHQQPRTEFDAQKLDDLAASLLDHGQLQPITVRWSQPHAKFLIVAGERRYRASVKAGLPSINADVIEDDDPVSIRIKQLVENCQREDLTPMEQARAFHAAMTAEGSRHSTAHSLAKMLKTSESAISRALKLLELPESIQQLVESEVMTPTTAYEVTKAPRPEWGPIVDQVIAEKLTVAETTNLVAEVRQAAERKPATKRGSTKAKAKLRTITTRVFKGQGGLRVTAERAKGLDLLALVEFLRLKADELEIEAIDHVPRDDQHEAIA